MVAARLEGERRFSFEDMATSNFGPWEGLHMSDGHWVDWMDTGWTLGGLDGHWVDWMDNQPRIVD